MIAAAEVARKATKPGGTSRSDACSQGVHRRRRQQGLAEGLGREEFVIIQTDHAVVPPPPWGNVVHLAARPPSRYRPSLLRHAKGGVRRGSKRGRTQSEAWYASAVVTSQSASFLDLHVRGKFRNGRGSRCTADRLVSDQFGLSLIPSLVLS